MKRNPFHGFFLFPLNLLINRKVVNLKIVWSLFKINSKQEQPQLSNNKHIHKHKWKLKILSRKISIFSLTNYYPYDDANSVRIFIRFFSFFFLLFHRQFNTRYESNESPPFPFQFISIRDNRYSRSNVYSLHRFHCRLHNLSSLPPFLRV